MRFKYTQEHIDFIRVEYRVMGLRELTEAFNRRFDLNKTRSAIHAAINNNGLTCGRSKGELKKGTSLIFTAAQVQFIKNNYQRLNRHELTSELNQAFQSDFKMSQLVAFVKNHNIVSGRTGRYSKGSIPRNKGTKGLTSRNRTTFSTGQIPPNRKPLGAERICRKDGFILIKIAEPNPYTPAKTRYKHKHVWVWEQANGPVPEGHAVVFKDSNKLNCELDNLMLLTRTELLSINLHGYREMPVELKPVILSIAKIEAKAGFRTRPGQGRRKKEAAL
ncbi:MAG: HNH endonuclease [Deltaproteobacteria bacterium]|nr:HNH endonuclease [Deltaproteobacteria bacterium]